MLPRYEPIAPIAEGGMARLQLARMQGEQGFTKYVAIKRILADGDDEFAAMFVDEARLSARMDHPNIVHVFDFGRDDDGFFMAMEYVHGPSLYELLRKARREGQATPLQHVVAVGMGVAAALAHAHARTTDEGAPLHIIHRDVSPSNILVTQAGTVKLADFGIALANSNRRKTGGNVRKGKVAYMSPEQCKAAPLDARSDIFALGAVLYEMCAGRRAFDGDDELAVLNNIVNHDVAPLSNHRRDLPEALEALILRMLDRDPAKRPARAEDVEHALEQIDALRPSRAGLAEWVVSVVGAKPRPWERTPKAAAVRVRGGDAPTVVKPPPLDEPIAPRESSRRGWIVGGLAAVAVAGWWWSERPAAAVGAPTPASTTTPSPPAPLPAPTIAPSPAPASASPAAPAPTPPSAAAIAKAPTASPPPAPDDDAPPRPAEDPAVRPDAHNPPPPTPANPRRPKRKKKAAPEQPPPPSFDRDGLAPRRPPS